jgi:hypothetical protein
MISVNSPAMVTRRGGLAMLLHALPGLRSPEKRKADESTHDEFSSAIGKPELTAIDSTGVGIQNVAADILIVLQPHIAYQDQSDDWLIPAFIGTLRASARSVIARRAWLYATEEEPSLLIDPDEAERSASLFVDWVPPASGR